MDESRVVYDVEVLEVPLEYASDAVSQQESYQESKQSTHKDLFSDWLHSSGAREKVGLDKSTFQRAIAGLVDEYQIPIQLLRRGEARATEYSGYCLELVKALRSGDKDSIQKLVAYAPSKINDSALVLADKNNFSAQQSEDKTVQDFQLAKSNLKKGVQNWRLLGASLAAKVSKEIKAGFAEQFNAEMQDLGMKAQDVFDID